MEFIAAPGDMIPLPPQSVDVIVFNHIYEHVPDPEAVMAEIRRVLKDDGVVYPGLGNRFGIMEPHYRLPFLSWLPKRYADRYVRVTGRADSYYERFRAPGAAPNAAACTCGITRCCPTRSGSLPMIGPPPPARGAAGLLARDVTGHPDVHLGGHPGPRPASRPAAFGEPGPALAIYLRTGSDVPGCCRGTSGVGPGGRRPSPARPSRPRRMP